MSMDEEKYRVFHEMQEGKRVLTGKRDYSVLMELNRFGTLVANQLKETIFSESKWYGYTRLRYLADLGLIATRPLNKITVRKNGKKIKTKLTSMYYLTPVGFEFLGVPFHQCRPEFLYESFIIGKLYSEMIMTGIITYKDWCRFQSYLTV
ncbi:MAG: hypothetical protein ACOY4Q_00580 [Bacillota bacterium]